MVKKLAQFKIKPGEDDPSGYVFVEADEEVVRGKRVWIVTLLCLEKRDESPPAAKVLGLLLKEAGR